MGTGDTFEHLDVSKGFGGSEGGTEKLLGEVMAFYTEYTNVERLKKVGGMRREASEQDIVGSGGMNELPS